METTEIIEAVPVEDEQNKIIFPPFPEIVRMRPGMYIGEVGSRGLLAMALEIVNNAVDAILADECNAVTITIGADESITVADNGHGIPVEVFENGKTGVELFLTDWHAADRLRRKPCIYSRAQHGGEICSVNALSDWLEVTVRKDSRVYSMRFERGMPIAPLELVGECSQKEHGTTIQWLADKTIFHQALTETGALVYNAASLGNHLKQVAYLLPEARFTLHDERTNDSPLIYHCPNGVSDFLVALNVGRDNFPAEPIRISETIGTTRIEAAIQWSGAPEETISSFANTVFTVGGGTHEKGLRRAVSLACNRFDLTSPIGSRKLTAIVAVMLPEVQFNSAGRDRLGNPEIEGLVFSVVYAALKKQFAGIL